MFTMISCEATTEYASNKGMQDSYNSELPFLVSIFFILEFTPIVQTVFNFRQLNSTVSTSKSPVINMAVSTTHSTKNKLCLS